LSNVRPSFLRLADPLGQPVLLLKAAAALKIRAMTTPDAQLDCAAPHSASAAQQLVSRSECDPAQNAADGADATAYPRVVVSTCALSPFRASRRYTFTVEA
jgi:hypothetical protein